MLEQEASVFILSSSARNDSRDEQGIYRLRWNPEKREISEQAFGHFEAVINLAGHTINCPWTTSNRRKILQSRVQSAGFLTDMILSGKIQTKLYISSSAIGIYSNTGEVKTEEHPKGKDFLSEVCQSWEHASEALIQANVRRVIFRLPVVLSNKGGMLPAILPLARLTGGVVAGSGKQHMSFVHATDVARAVSFAIEDTHAEGTYNLSAPEIPTALDFAEDLAHAISRKLFITRTPAFIFRLVLGARSGLLLDDQQIDGSKLRSLGFQYQFNSIDEALSNLYPRR
jgi:uncharacterized protein (TIGR01777 family)